MLAVPGKGITFGCLDLNCVKSASLKHEHKPSYNLGRSATDKALQLSPGKAAARRSEVETFGLSGCHSREG